MITAPFHYECETERWLLKNDKGDTLDAFEVLAIAYDPQTFTLLKHGEKSRVRKWMQEQERIKRYYNLDLVNYALAEFSVGYSVSEVNKALHTSGYMRYIVAMAEEGVVPGEPAIPEETDEHPF